MSASRIGGAATLIVGIGSSLRGDDGAGEAVIRRLEKEDLPDCRLLAADVTGLDLLKYFRPGEDVILVDAVDAGLAPGRIIVLPRGEIPAAGFSSITSTHGVSLGRTVALAGTAGLDNRITLVGIQAADVSYRQGLSPEAESGVGEAVRTILGLLGR